MLTLYKCLKFTNNKTSLWLNDWVGLSKLKLWNTPFSALFLPSKRKNKKNKNTKISLSRRNHKWAPHKTSRCMTLSRYLASENPTYNTPCPYGKSASYRWGGGFFLQDLTWKAKQENNWLICNTAAHTDPGSSTPGLSQHQVLISFSSLGIWVLWSTYKHCFPEPKGYHKSLFPVRKEQKVTNGWCLGGKGAVICWTLYLRVWHMLMFTTEFPKKCVD